MLMNYIALEKDVPTRLHFTDHYTVTREIWDDKLGRLKEITSLVLWCDEQDGEPTARTFSVVSEGLATILRPYLPGHTYIDFTFEITKQGEGFSTRYQVQAIPKS